MLNIEEKINYLKDYLLSKKCNYGDVMKDEIYLYLFGLQEDSYDANNFSFLDKLKTIKEIEVKLDFVVSKMILHEEEDGLCNIIEEFL